eukprot:1600584-Prymnesium_polylepis.1
MITSCVDASTEPSNSGIPENITAFPLLVAPPLAAAELPTAALDVPFGVKILRLRQSSERPAQRPSRVKPRQSGYGMSGWQRAESEVASKTPFHPPSGCGAAHRSLPSGAAAKGMPRKTSARRMRLPLSKLPSAILIVTGGVGGAGGLSQHSYE